MKLRLSDSASFAALAEHFGLQAEMCRQMALTAARPFKESWLELAAEWTKLAEETEAKSGGKPDDAPGGNHPRLPI